MKNLFLFALFAVLWAFAPQTAFAQSHGEMADDTLTTSGALDTAYQYVGGATFATKKLLANFDELEINVRLDSLSGATNGTLFVEYTNSLEPTETGDMWFPAPAGSSSFTYNGATTQATNTARFTVNGVACLLTFRDTNLNCTYARVRYLTTSATQSTRHRGWWAIKR